MRGGTSFALPMMLILSISSTGSPFFGFYTEGESYETFLTHTLREGIFYSLARGHWEITISYVMVGEASKGDFPIVHMLVPPMFSENELHFTNKALNDINFE
jgi:hypothetical protein